MFSFLFILSVFGYALGAPSIEGRIVGGDDANILDYPYQISLMYYDFHICGGSILNKDTILTAAHCVDEMEVDRLHIRAGSSSHTKGGQIIDVKSYKMHSLYDSKASDNDIAIMKLSTNLVFGPGVATIALVKHGMIIEGGTKAIVSGWGAIYFTGPSLDVLQVVEVPVVDQIACAETLSGVFNLTSRHLCASEKGKDSCQGDSGGPLVLNNELIGVVSWGVGCALQYYPGVYVRVSEYISWIQPQL